MYLCAVITLVGNDLLKVLDFLRAGELVAIPTETVYGLAADCMNDRAVQKIFEVKQRPTTNPLILHVESIERIYPLVNEFPDTFKHLANVFCPGPLTFLIKKSSLVSEYITAGNDRVAVRIPKHPLTLKLIAALDAPIAAPSANLYGKLSPTEAKHVKNQLDGKIPYILDGGECQRGIESTIIGLEKNEVVIYRLGSITPEDLAQHLGYMPGLKVHSNDIPVASGMVKYHYAPITTCSFFDPMKPCDESAGYIFLSKNLLSSSSINMRILSPTENLDEAAKNLYSTLHDVDNRGFSHIYIEKVPDVGIGMAINDRISRAVAKFHI